MVHERWRRQEGLVTNIIRNTDSECIKDLLDNPDLLDEPITLDCTTQTNHCICTVNFEYLHKPEHIIKCLRKRKCFHCQRYQCMRRDHVTITSSTSPILLAAALGKFQVFKFLHQKGCSLESKSGVHELRPLHLAITHGHFNIFCYLLANQVDINATLKSNGTSYSPLMQAVIYNRKEMIRHLLMMKGLDLSFRNSLSQSPILFAVQHNNLDLMDLLLGAEETYSNTYQGQNPGRLNKLKHPCAILEAIKQDNSSILKTLLNNGCDPDYIFNGYRSYTTAAILAAVKNSHCCFKLLISYGADVNTQIEGFSAIDWVEQFAWPECIEALNYGSQRTCKDAVDEESFFESCNMNNLLPDGLTVSEMPNCIPRAYTGSSMENEEKTTNLGLVNNNNELPCSPMIAVWNLVQWLNIDDEIQRLASLGHDVNIQDNYGRTSLHIAVEEQHVYGVRALLQLGANTDIPDMCGATPLWHAVFWNKESMIKELIAANAHLECKANENAYKLGLPSSENYRDAIRQRELHKTPLYTAVEKNFHETVALLLEAGYNCKEDNLEELVEISRDENKKILVEHLNKPKTLFAATRDSLRRAYGRRIFAITDQYYLPARVKYCLLLKDVLDCAFSVK